MMCTDQRRDSFADQRMIAASTATHSPELKAAGSNPAGRTIF